jgi:hypothetical protein
MVDAFKDVVDRLSLFSVVSNVAVLNVDTDGSE